MSEKRYSHGACAKVSGLTVSAIQYRARRLNIDTSRGISAAELQKIKNYAIIRKKHQLNTLEELQEEMRAMK